MMSRNSFLKVIMVHKVFKQLHNRLASRYALSQHILSIFKTAYILNEMSAPTNSRKKVVPMKLINQYQLKNTEICSTPTVQSPQTKVTVK